MPDLWLALIMLALPRVWAAVGTPNVVIGSIATASILIWPGYVIVRWLWPHDSMSLSQRLAYIPAFGVLSATVVSLLAWVTLQRATLEIANTLMLIAMTVIILGIVATRPLSSEDSGQRTQTYREFAAALAMFLALSIGIGLADGVPQLRTDAPALAIYLDPTSAPAYDRTTDSVGVAIVVTSAETSPAMSLRLTADVSGQLVAEKRIGLAPGEHKRIDLNIPASVLSPRRAQAVEIRLQSTGAPGANERRLRLWLSASR